MSAIYHLAPLLSPSSYLLTFANVLVQFGCMNSSPILLTVIDFVCLFKASPTETSMNCFEKEGRETGKRDISCQWPLREVYCGQE